MAKRKLTVKQDKFVRNYVKNGGNGSKAARDAGYAKGGTKIGVMAHDNLNKPRIRNAINEMTIKALKANDLTREHVIEGLMKESGLDGQGGPKDSGQGGRVRAMELCGKALGGMFLDRVEDGTEALTPIELVAKLIRDGCPRMAVGACHDLGIVTLATEEVVRLLSPDIADELLELIPNTLSVDDIAG